MVVLNPFSRTRTALAALSLIALVATAPVASAADLPDYMDVIVAGTPPTPAESATQNVLALNESMFSLYAASGRVFRQNILAQHPVILALFSGAGGRFLLYRPGAPAIEGAPVPVAYQLLKSVGHSTMVLPVLAGPHIDKAADQSWQAPMRAFLARMVAARDGIEQTDMPKDWQAVAKATIEANIAFIDESLAKNVITLASVTDFTTKQNPRLKELIRWAAETQVAHWMGVVGEWKTILGADWDKAYAASNTIYVARQNNVLFSVLAQYFPPEAINDRLLLIETVSFTTTPEDMMDSLTRIVSDRVVGTLFFKSDHLMDYELMGGNARDAITAEAGKRGMTPLLPPLVPFGSHQWPTLVTPGPGAATLADLP